jgi:hypothetical protein
MANVRSEPTIVVDILIDNGKVDEKVSYNNGQSSNGRKEKLLDEIRKKKAKRGPGVNKALDHSEDFHHPSWITEPGEVVVFRCRNYFRLLVHHDPNVCQPIASAPDNPFDWEGVQEAVLGSDGYEVRGTAVRDVRVLDQMFYKFTAFIDGIREPFDPDGICGSTGH